MSDASALVEAYRPIWDMVSPRSSCVIPEVPFVVTAEQERELIELTQGVWSGISTAVDIAGFSQRQPWQSIRNAASTFPEGLTLPPAVRVDVVKSTEGFKVVEIDPITAISLGETALLEDIWSSSGNVVSSPIGEIIEAVRQKGCNRLSVDLPTELQDYTAETWYLSKALQARGLGVDLVGYGESSPVGSVSLSAYMEVPRRAKIVNRMPGNQRGYNPLFGPLVGLASKDRTAAIIQASDDRICPYITQELTRQQLVTTDDELVLCKPKKGSGSRGIRIASPKEAITFSDDYVIQKILEPQLDDFGECRLPDGTSINAENWVSRISLYASERGLCGAQVTARRQEGQFTNAHGQADAIQTAIVVE